MSETRLNLVDRHCRADAALLAAQELETLRAQLPDWKVTDEPRLTRTFRFPDFRTALDFVNRVGEVAEAESHHPDLCLAWGRVDVTTWSHDAGGLTESDFVLAAKVDRAYSAG